MACVFSHLLSPAGFQSLLETRTPENVTAGFLGVWGATLVPFPKLLQKRIYPYQENVRKDP